MQPILSLVGGGMRSVRADLHNHIGTKQEISDKYGVEKILDQSHQTLGDGGIICIVNFLGQDRTPDHFHFDNFHNAANGNFGEIILGNAIYFSERDLLVVKGEEVVVFENAYESHLLFLGTEYGTNMTPGSTFELAVEEGRRKNAIIGLDHSFARTGLLYPVMHDDKRIEEIVGSVDFMEVHNGEMCLPFFGMGSNQMAQNFYDYHKGRYPDLGAVISSDGHSLEEIGSSYIELVMPKKYSCLTDSEEVLRYLGSTILGSRNPSGKRCSSYKGAFKHGIRILPKLKKKLAKRS